MDGAWGYKPKLASSKSWVQRTSARFFEPSPSELIYAATFLYLPHQNTTCRRPQRPLQARRILAKSSCLQESTPSGNQSSKGGQGSCLHARRGQATFSWRMRKHKMSQWEVEFSEEGYRYVDITALFARNLSFVFQGSVLGPRGQTS